MTSLAGIRVLDLSRVLAGPWCTQTLADLGADVIKVERPGTGDDTRTWGPPFLKDAAGHDTAEAAYYLGANRNKRSVTCDIALPAGQALIRELVQRCDVFIENFKVGDMARYGLDYAALSARNPRLVYCSITGFGQTGPYRERAGYDYAIQGMGGLMSVTGERDDLGGGPQKVGVAVADLFTGMYATVAILAALRHAERTGERPVHRHGAAGHPGGDARQSRRQLSRQRQGAGPRQATRTRTSCRTRCSRWRPRPTATRTTSSWRSATTASTRSSATSLAVPTSRSIRASPGTRTGCATAPCWCRCWQQIMKTRTKAQWLAALEQARVPCGAINNLQEVFADPQVNERGMVTHWPHPLQPDLKLVSNPMKLSATPVRSRAAAAAAGPAHRAGLARAARLRR